MPLVQQEDNLQNHLNVLTLIQKAKGNCCMKKVSGLLQRDVIETISYILLTCSVFYAGYMSMVCYLNGINLIVDKKYQFANYLFIIACVVYYRNSSRDVIKEMIKSTTILLATNIIQFYVDGSGEIRKTVLLAIYQLFYHLIAFIIIMVGIKYSEKQHGKRAQLLILIFLLQIGIMFFVLRINICVTLIISCVINMLVGYRFYVKFNNEKKNEEENKAKKIELEKKKELDIINMKYELEKCKKENSIIKSKLERCNNKRNMKKSKNHRRKK